MLKKDRAWRGFEAIHVRKHPKLGKHRTILSVAVPVIETVLALREVSRVHLGLIANVSSAKAPKIPEIAISDWGNHLRVVIRGQGAAQIFRITTKQTAYVQDVLNSAFQKCLG